MNSSYNYVCEDSNIHINVSVPGSGVAHITLFYNNEPAISRKYLFSEFSQESSNELVVAFCEILSENKLRESRFQSEEDTTEFFAEAIRSSLKKVYTKLGLLLWQRK